MSAANWDDPCHHLKRTPAGYWKVRVTIETDPKKIGKRVTIGLKTHDPEAAARRRDRLIAAMVASGILRFNNHPPMNQCRP